MMTGFIDYYKEHWYYLIVLVALCVIAAFVFKKARKAYKGYYSRYRAEESRMKRLSDLKTRFSGIDEESLRAENDEDVLEGVALIYQLALQKEDNMEKAFAQYNVEKQYAYALDIFCQSEKPSAFFRENGRELTEIIVPAFEYIGLKEDSEQIERLRLMFDEKDESTSISPVVIEEIDGALQEKDIAASVKLSAAKKIKAEAEKFLLSK